VPDPEAATISANDVEVMVGASIAECKLYGLQARVQVMGPGAKPYKRRDVSAWRDGLKASTKRPK